MSRLTSEPPNVRARWRYKAFLHTHAIRIYIYSTSMLQYSDRISKLTRDADGAIMQCADYIRIPRHYLGLNGVSVSCHP